MLLKTTQIVRHKFSNRTSTEQVNLKNDFHQTDKFELNTPNLK